MEGDALKDLREHVGVLDGSIVILEWTVISEMVKEGKKVLREYLTVAEGAPWSGRLLGKDAAVDDFFDLGYMGSYRAEYRAVDELREEGLSLSRRRRQRLVISMDEYGDNGSLLQSVADPRLRRESIYDIPESLSSGVPINAGQRAVLDGMKFEIEAIQGPPGTGKSTLIFHVRTLSAVVLRNSLAPHRFWQIMNSYVAADEVTLATCVQNKAVDSIADKLASSGFPFFVIGNVERLSLVATEWTLDAQVRRDERVIALTEELSACAVRLAELEDKRLTDESAVALAALASFNVMRVKAALDAQKESVYAELVESARAILNTVATAAGSLQSNASIAPAVDRITTAVLDEAGTCSESKIPLLLRLPELARIIAVGDQKQLQPFTY